MQCLWAAVEAKLSEWTAQAGGAPGCRPRALPGARALSWAAVHSPRRPSSLHLHHLPVFKNVCYLSIGLLALVS